ncbi:hypothetical protein ACFL0L_02235 [Patescibacteria group bacterium]
MSLVEISRALISVSDKTGLIQLAAVLESFGIEIISTGGTMAVLAEANLKVIPVEQFTGMPEILGGRLKTLHPRVLGNLLSRLGNAQDAQDMDKVGGVAPIGLVVVNLYPFAEKLAAKALDVELIENIDIGGPAILRGAAKNHERVTAIHSPSQYDELCRELLGNSGKTTLEFRRRCAGQVFVETSSYDKAIGDYLTGNS